MGGNSASGAIDTRPTIGYNLISSLLLRFHSCYEHDGYCC